MQTNQAPAAPAAERPLPQPTDATRPYWEGAVQGKLLIQQCASCGRHQFYPRLFCTACLSDEIRWVEASGHGTVYSYTVNHRGSTPYFKPRTPYVVAVIDLEEGVRLMTNIVDCEPRNVRIGARVQVCFEAVNATLALPQFRLAGTER
ncbi:Zn-ribbon domain-containing OB-fold protein [Bordetella genomosp. 13]|uniref:Zn-ribbon domain-containing OB-fold protein n=1 Tax=Bordetella genomosp. 13 TaxID=463040 RepID=UPI0011A968EE|nr:Zn-ribbon domain-containing OB-fold protein [Bordetella genomosp. 13]